MKHLNSYEKFIEKKVGENINEGRYKWKPSASLRRDFAQNMKDPEYAKSYHDRKEEKENKRREKSKYDYNTAGGEYIPTKQQYDFTMNYDGDLTDEQGNAFSMVRIGYITQDKVNHDYIHIVNELIRRRK